MTFPHPRPGLLRGFLFLSLCTATLVPARQPLRPFPNAKPAAGPAPAGSFQAGNVPQGLASLDFDHDGKLDLAVTNAFDDTVRVYRGNGAGGFALARTIPVNRHAGIGDDLPRQIIALDLNRDGHADLATVNSGNPSILVAPSVAVIETNLKSDFEPARFASISASGNPQLSFSLDAGLLDSHGLPDLIVGNYGSNSLSRLENSGSFRFDSGIDFPVSTAMEGPIAVSLADFDLDGDLDVILANDVDLAILPGDGSGGFGAAASFAPGTAWSALAVSDFDNDGAYDVAALDSDAARVRTFFSVAITGAFDHSVDTPLPFPGAASITTADFNADGREDIAVALLDNSRVAILLGQAGGLFALSPEIFTTGLGPRTVIAADLNGDGMPDLASANEGDQTVPANEDVSLWLNSLSSSAPLAPEFVDESASSASLGAGILRAAGAGWHAARGSLYVAAPEEHALVEVSPAGARLSTLTTSGLGAFDPSDVAVDPISGNLFFTDRLEARVYRITVAGALVASFSTVSAGSTRPSGIAYDTDAGRLLVSDERNEEVYAYSLSGSLLESYEAPDPLTDLTFVPATGRLWGFSDGIDEISEFSFEEGPPRLKEEDKIALQDISEVADEMPLTGLAFDPAASRFMILGPRALLVQTSLAGAPLGAIELGLGLGLAGADGDPDTGDLWMLDSGLLGTVMRLSGGTASVAFTAQDLGTSEPIDPRGLAVGPSSIFIASRRHERILRFSRAGALQSDIELPWSTEQDVLGLEFDPVTNHLYLMTPGRIHELNLSGTLLGSIPCTLARRFGDLSLDAANDRFALYAEDRGEIWYVGRTGEFMARAMTPGFLPPDWPLRAGAIDPADPARHFLGASAASIVTRVSLKSTVAASVHGWNRYE